MQPPSVTAEVGCDTVCRAHAPNRGAAPPPRMWACSFSPCSVCLRRRGLRERASLPGLQDTAPASVGAASRPRLAVLILARQSPGYVTRGAFPNLSASVFLPIRWENHGCLSAAPRTVLNELMQEGRSAHGGGTTVLSRGGAAGASHRGMNELTGGVWHRAWHIVRVQYMFALITALVTGLQTDGPLR